MEKAKDQPDSITEDGIEEAFEVCTPLPNFILFVFTVVSTPKILLVLLEILGFIASCDLTFIPVVNFLSLAIVFKPIVHT